MMERKLRQDGRQAGSLSHVLFLAVWLFGSGVCANAVEVGDWPLARGDAASSGSCDSKMPEQPKLLWEFQVEKGAFESTPIIVAGRVYIGDMDGEVYCLSLADGKQLWKLETDSGFLAGGAFRDQLLVIGDYDGKVRGINATDGTVRWTYETDAQIDSGINFFGDLALIASQDGSLHALKSDTGVLAWKYQTGDQLRCTPTVVGHRTFLGGCDGQLHTVDLQTGTALGKSLPLGGPSGSTPAVQGKMVIVPTHPGAIFGMNWEENQQVWSFVDPELSPEVRSSPAVNQDLAFLTTRNRRVLALEIATGKLRWQAVLRKRSDSSPVVCDGRIWLGASDGRLYSLDIQTGVERWTMELAGAFQGSPAIAENRLVIASDKGSVFCFGEAIK